MLTSLQGIAMDPVPYLQGERLDRLLDLLARVGMTEFERAYATHAANNRHHEQVAAGSG
jgi:hypothetical protein